LKANVCIYCVNVVCERTIMLLPVHIMMMIMTIKIMQNLASVP
jgi:hypothetical protein